MAAVDSLDIQISAQANKASASLDRLVGKLNTLSSSLSRINGSGLTGLANGVNGLSNAMQSMKSVGTADFTRLAKNVQKLSQIDTASISRAASAMSQMSKGLTQLNNVSVSGSAAQLGQLAKGISQLGYKSATQAITNIPKLATAMKDLMKTLSTAPQVSQNIINMTNALAKLARTGASSGKAANSLSKALNTYSSSSNRAAKSSFSLASAIGKLYASYWLLLRAFRKIGDAINIASDLTEVQNVVDVTFGKYASLVEKMSETSITDFGMSELTVKQVSSRFQAMGTAMGFTQSKMADMSIELTKLAADMASFYNVEQADVAEDLAAIFTGQTKPLRTYGLDLTEATLQEWAMKRGLDANIEAMSQAEKTMLRYQYVMANTGAAQGDFARTSDTWANQIRILRQNFEQLGAVIGGTFINALKPLVKALNSAMGAIINFAKVVSNALGKIFGWTYEESGGGIANNYEDAAGYAGDLADSTGKAAGNAKKLKQQLQGFDELNVLTSQDSNISGGGGTGDGGGIGGTTDVSGGQWKKTDSILKDYESELDTLYKLGDYIGKTLTDTLNSIDWDSVYEGARNFGSGLANFLNGLISPELFGVVGKTIASSLNIALYSLNSFGTTFDWRGFGNSIATGINDFFKTFDFAAFSETLNIWVDGIKDALWSALKEIKWENILNGIADLLTNLDLDTVVIGIAAFKWMHGGKEIVKGSLSNLLSSKIKTGIGDGEIPITKALSLSFTTAIVGFKIGNWLYDHIPKINEWANSLAEWLFDGKDTINIAKAITVSLGSLALSVGAVTLGSTAISAISTAISSAVASSTVTTATTTALGTGLRSAISSVGGIGGLLTMDIGTVLGAGTLAEIGLTLGTAILGGVTAAFAGFEIGKLIDKYITKPISDRLVELGFSPVELIANPPEVVVGGLQDEVDKIRESEHYSVAGIENTQQATYFEWNGSIYDMSEAEEFEKATGLMVNSVTGAVYAFTDYAGAAKDVTKQFKPLNKTTQEYSKRIKNLSINNKTSTSDIVQHYKSMEVGIQNSLDATLTPTQEYSKRIKNLSINNKTSTSDIVQHYKSMATGIQSNINATAAPAREYSERVKNLAITNATSTSDIVQHYKSMADNASYQTGIMKNNTIGNAINAVEGIKAQSPNLSNAVGSAMYNAKSQITSQDWYTPGVNLVAGLESGITNRWGIVGSAGLKAKLIYLANNLTSTLEDAFDINSPSRVWAEIGNYLDLGLLDGLESGENLLNSRVKSMGGRLTNTFSNSFKLTSPPEHLRDMGYDFDYKNYVNYKYSYDGVSESISKDIKNSMYLSQMEQNELLREQNDLLMRILEKDTSISQSEVFDAVRRENNRIYNQTGTSPLVK